MREGAGFLLIFLKFGVRDEYAKVRYAVNVHRTHTVKVHRTHTIVRGGELKPKTGMFLQEYS